MSHAAASPPKGVAALKGLQRPAWASGGGEGSGGGSGGGDGGFGGGGTVAPGTSCHATVPARLIKHTTLLHEDHNTKPYRREATRVIRRLWSLPHHCRKRRLSTRTLPGRFPAPPAPPPRTSRGSRKRRRSPQPVKWLHRGASVGVLTGRNRWEATNTCLRQSTVQERPKKRSSALTPRLGSGGRGPKNAQVCVALALGRERGQRRARHACGRRGKQTVLAGCAISAFCGNNAEAAVTLTGEIPQGERFAGHCNRGPCKRGEESLGKGRANLEGWVSRPHGDETRGG